MAPGHRSPTRRTPFTVLLVAFDDADCDIASREAAAGCILLAGGTDVPGTGPGRLAATFPCARDAARAAVEIARTPANTRMVLATMLDTPAPAQLGATVERLSPLLASVPAGRVLVTATAAIVAGTTLPSGVDLIDRATSWRAEPDLPAERLFELRIGAPGGSGDGSSNLAWARRAAAEQRAGSTDVLRTLTGMWQQARTGRLRTALITSDTAADAHAATADLALRLHAEDALVLYGRWDTGTSTPYQAVREAFGVYADSCDPARLRRDLDGRASDVSRLLPEVGTRVGVARRSAQSPQVRPCEAYEAIGTWLSRTARRRPIVLVLHDLQYADRPSVGLLEHLWHACRRDPVLVVLTAVDAGRGRDDNVDRLLTAGVQAEHGAFRRVLL